MNPKQIVEQIRKELKNKASTKTEKEREKAVAIFGDEAKLLAKDFQMKRANSL